MSDYEGAAQAIILILGEDGATQLLWLMDQDSDVRADAFKQLHEHGGHPALLDALHNLEADPENRVALVAALRHELGD